MAASPSPTAFFFFGCWNRDNCEGDKIDWRQIVLDNVKANEGKFSFGIIAGDNVYPQKQNGIKADYVNTVTRGFDQLKAVAASTKEKHVILGNHNVKMARNPTNGSITSINNRLSLESDFFLYDKPAHHVTMNEKIDYVFLNTNFFSHEISAKLKPIEQFKVELGKCKSNLVYIVGHEPLMAAKHKKGVDKLVHLDMINPVFDAIMKWNNLHKASKVIYLCADVHNFQVLTITKEGFTLPIIVCGTGGAEPDPVAHNPPKSITITEINQCKAVSDCHIYNVEILSQAEAYGYSIIDGNTVTYYPVAQDMAKIEKQAKTANGSSAPGVTVNIESQPITTLHKTDCTFTKKLEGGRPIVC